MSPEQVVDERIDGRSDIYSLGVIFYQMVTGRFPFDGTEALSVMYKHVNENATPPNLIHKIPDKVSDIIMKLLAKDREKRYQTGEALMEDLDALPPSISGKVKSTRATFNGKEHAPNPELAQTIKVQSVAVELAPPRKRGPVANASFSRGMGTLFQRFKKDKRSITGLMGGFVLVLLAAFIFLLLKSPKSVEPESEPQIVADQFARGEMFHELDRTPQSNRLLSPPIETADSNPDPQPEEVEEPVVSTPSKPPEKKRSVARPKKLNAKQVLKKEIQGILREMGVVVIPAGSFEMGSKSKLNWAERPVHEVKLNGFSLGKTEVTQELWMAVMGSTPSCESGSNQPVTNISWDECRVFIEKLNGLTGEKWRLPTEAEWEYACQLGGDETLDEQVWYNKNSGGAPHDVLTKSPDATGLRHMRGNVWEWVSDYYGKRYYKDSPLENPKGPDTGDARVIRGGSWNDKAGYCRCEKRESLFPVLKNCEVGFRLAK